MAPFEALYGRLCRSPACWIESSDRLVHGPDMIWEAFENVDFIWKKLKTAHSRRISYANHRRRTLEFQVGDSVFLKVSPIRGGLRFGKTGKLAPFPKLQRIGPLAYRV